MTDEPGDPAGDETSQQIAALVKERRHELGLTQEQAAARGRTVSVATWRVLESGTQPPERFSLRTNSGVARALGWNLSWLLDILDGRAPRADEPYNEEPSEYERTGPAFSGAPRPASATDSDLATVLARLESVSRQLTSIQAEVERLAAAQVADADPQAER